MLPTHIHMHLNINVRFSIYPKHNTHTLSEGGICWRCSESVSQMYYTACHYSFPLQLVPVVHITPCTTTLYRPQRGQTSLRLSPASPFLYTVSIFCHQRIKFKERAWKQENSITFLPRLKRTVHLLKRGKKMYVKKRWWTGMGVHLLVNNDTWVLLQCKTDQNWLFTLWNTICKLPLPHNVIPAVTPASVCIAVNSSFINNSCIIVALVH